MADEPQARPARTDALGAAPMAEQEAARAELAEDVAEGAEVEVHPVVLRLQERGSLATRVRRGLVATTASRLLIIVLQLASLTLVARFLAPSDYGLYAIAGVFNRFAALLTELGLSSALVQSRRLTDRLLATAFWVNAIVGIVTTVVLVAIAPLVTYAYGEPRVGPILQVASLTFALNVAAVPTALLQRTLRFRLLGTLELIGNVITVAATLAFAAAGLGAMSLVLGPLCQIVAMDVMVWAAVRWVPRSFGGRAEVRELWRYGRGLAGSNLLYFASRNADTLSLGKVVGTGPLGLYSRSYQMMMLPLTQVSSMVTRVLLPAYAEMHRDLPRLRRAWLTTTRTSLLIGLPAGWGVAISASALVATIFPAKYAGMVPSLVLLAASVPPQLVSRNMGPLFQAMDRTALQFRTALVSSSVTVAGILLALPWGTTGVAASIVVTSVFAVLQASWRLLPIIELPARDLWGAIWPVLLAGVVMVAAAGGAGLAAAPLAAPLTLALQVVAGAVGYGAALWFLDPHTTRPLLLRAGRRVRRLLPGR